MLLWDVKWFAEGAEGSVLVMGMENGRVFVM